MKMDYKFLIMLGMALCFIGIAGAYTEFTPTTDTICNDGVCTKTLYSGIRNVYEDNQWKKVEDARSLMDKGFEIKVLEDDKDFPVDVIDFNATSIQVRLNPSGVKIFNQNVPVRIWEQNQKKEFEFEENVREGIKVRKGVTDYKEKMDKVTEDYRSFNLLNQEDEVTYEFGIGKILEFGFNSTTIILQDADTENLADSYYETVFPSNNYGSSNILKVGDSSDDQKNILIKFNLTELSSRNTTQIIEAYLNLYIIDNDLSGTETWNVSIHNIDRSYFFNESNLTGDNAPTTNQNGSIIDDILLNSSSNGWKIWNVTNNVFDYINDTNITFTLKTHSPSTLLSSFDSTDFASKEYATSSQRPYLNITYNFTDTFSPNVTINSPLNKTYNTNSIIFNITATDDLSSIDTCSYSFDSGEHNLSLSNYTTQEIFNATNNTLTIGGYKVNFYCTDTEGNLNDTEFRYFAIEWAGVLNSSYRLNENYGSKAHDFISDYEGNITGASWITDGINNTLIENTDYNLSGALVTLINQRYAWSLINISYETTNTTKEADELITDTIDGTVSFFSNITTILSIVAISIIILALSIIIIAVRKNSGGGI